MAFRSRIIAKVSKYRKMKSPTRCLGFLETRPLYSSRAIATARSCASPKAVHPTPFSQYSDEQAPSGASGELKVSLVMFVEN